MPSIRKVNRVVESAKIARKWLKLGIYPVPLASKTKRPKSERDGGDAKGWNKLRVTPETVEQFFAPGDNVGGLWGEPSRWIIDIDLDTEEARLAAPLLLPETFIYGRASAPGSHYLYECPMAATTKFQSKHLGMLAEVRATGTQSVLPGSIHPDNERYRVDHEVGFAKIKKADLEHVTKLLAAAAVAGYYYPEKGGRHDYVHALAGAVLWNGWEDDDVRKWMAAVQAAADGKDHAKSDRDYTVENTIEHFKAGDRIAGWPTLSQFMPGEELALLKRWLGLKKGPDNSATPPDSVTLTRETSIKPELLEVPGLVGEIARWQRGRCYVEQPLFDLAFGLACIALASRNKYLVSHWRTPLQPYMLLLAPTANGKDSALSGIFEVARRIGMASSVCSGFQSYHAMLDRLSEPPGVLVWTNDEAARKLKTVGKAVGGQDFQILTYLLSLYGKANTSVPGMPGRKTEIKPLDFPFFSPFWAAQPEQLVEAITDSDVSLGLINRFILFDAGEKNARRKRIGNSAMPTRVEDGLREFERIKRPAGSESFIEIGFDSNEAFRIFEDFSEHCRENAVEGGGFEMWGRANQNALICAGLVAIGINPKRPKITESIGNWAVELLRWCSERWTTRVEQSASRSLMERYSKHVQRMIFTVRSLRSRASGRPGELALIDRGIMPRSLLVRLSRHLRGKDLDDVVSQLILADLVGSGEIDGYECYWIKGTDVKTT